MKKMLQKLILVGLSSFLCACGTFFDKDNAPPPSPLVTFTPQAKVHQLWNVSTGFGVGNDYFKFIPAVKNQQIFTASKNGSITATNRITGKRLWQINTGTLISAGPATTDNLVIIATQAGEILALRQTDGKVAWKAHTSSEVLAAPAASKEVVLIKTIDGRLSAFSVVDGHTLWHYQQTEPTLILRGASAPQISNDIVIAGFANGNVARLTLPNGNLLWLQPIATPTGSFAIQRMIDIDADPIIFGNHVYAATYQGQIAALNLATGQIIWTHDLSSFSGMAVDEERVYISDAKSNIWAFDRESGRVDWRQTQLEARTLSGPAIMGDTIIVGDAEGYLHWLNKSDGHFIARTRVDLSGIITAPIVDHNILYVATRDGQLAAYSL
jgi:outer membrane protein assembly factor BamB